jgi:hypothetical protein
MRRYVFVSIAFIAGLAAGASTRSLALAKQRVGIPEMVAIVSVLPPDFDGMKDHADTSVDAVWQRKINDTVFALKLPDNLRGPLMDPDVAPTAWYGRFDDDSERLGALQAGLHVEQVPGCSFILVRFDGASAPDARTIANTVIRHHMSDALVDTRCALNDRITILRDTLNSLLRAEEDIIARAINLRMDEMKLEWLQPELKDVAERRRAMQHDYEKARAQLFEADLSGVRVVRWGRVPRED